MAFCATLCLGLLTACTTETQTRQNEFKAGEFAHGFSIESKNGQQTLLLFDHSAEGEKQVTRRYILGDSTHITDSIVTLPREIGRIACLSSTHIGFLAELNCEGLLVGVSTPSYISNEFVQSGLTSGTIRDIGTDMNLDYEIIVKQAPDVLLAYSLRGTRPEFITRIEGLGIPVLMIGEFMENDPLGRAEWIRVFGLLTGKERRADSIFSAVVTEYKRLENLTADVKKRPRVLLNTPWRESWFIPGRQSFMSAFLKAAGAHNALGDQFDDGSSHSVSFETVVAEGFIADYWLNPGICRTKEELVALNEIFSNFPSVQAGQIYNNTRRMNPMGGNDFWESGVCRPDVVLHDMLCIFHPELLEGEKQMYYHEQLR